MHRGALAAALLVLAPACGSHAAKRGDTPAGAVAVSGAAQPDESPEAGATEGMDATGPSGSGGSMVRATGGASAGSPGGSSGGGTTVVEGGVSDSSASPTPALTHTFDPIAIAAGSEITDLCQSWTLSNDTPILVNRVVESNEGYFHHSNWIWVPDSLYAGMDGTWNCADRGFEQISAGALGGVFFAQSTQSKTDTQAFAPGIAFQMPAHARIIGNVHLINASAADATTSMTFDVDSIPPANLSVGLQPMAFTNISLDIAANGTTDARMDCAVPQPDFGIYYVLPHFHVLGQFLQVDVVGGPMDGTTLFHSQGTFGEPQGRSFDPPLHVTGATGLRVTCEYLNTRGVSVAYGEGDQEMCVALLYTDGYKAGGTTLANYSVTDTAGVHTTDALCAAVGTPNVDP